MAVDYEHAGRVAKARALADVLRLRGAVATEAMCYSAAERAAVAAQAGKRAPSDLTWEYVVADLRLRELLEGVAAAADQDFVGL